jgi:hypothetical protein
VSYYAGHRWAVMPYASTTHYACFHGFGADASCDAALEAVAGANAARSQDWSSVAHGGDTLLVGVSGTDTYSGVPSCDPASYNEGYLGAWQTRCAANSGTVSETSEGYNCHVPPPGSVPSPFPKPSPSPSPSPTPAPAPAPPDYAGASAVPLAVAGAIAVGVIIWKVFS